MTEFILRIFLNPTIQTYVISPTLTLVTSTEVAGISIGGIGLGAGLGGLMGYGAGRLFNSPNLMYIGASIGGGGGWYGSSLILRTHGGLRRALPDLNVDATHGGIRLDAGTGNYVNN